MAVVLFAAQIVFVLIGRKKDLELQPQSHWAVKLIPFFIGLQGFTVFALPWASWDGSIDFRFFDMLEGALDRSFKESLLIYSELLFICFSLMVTSSMIQLAFKVNKKTVATYLYEMLVSCFAVLLGALLMKHIETDLMKVNWPMNIGGSPLEMPNLINIRYGLYLIFVLSAANMILQSLLFFKSSNEVKAGVPNEQANSNSEILDDLD
ncbi:MAG: peptidoglycan/LPS O-acetylase OafA/YrhL [Salibacteraceae bacterium]|jgi:peptidoglycan/LPS O-acetylase OafA/YrhL